MDKTLTLRQQKYRDRQKKLGRKALTVQLPLELIERLHTGKGTADTMSAYVERLLLAGIATVTNNDTPGEIPKKQVARAGIEDVANNGGLSEALKSHDWDADEKKFAEDIERSKYRYVLSLAESGNTAGVIAQKLTFAGYPTPAGKTRWTAATVRSILQKAKKLKR